MMLLENFKALNKAKNLHWFDKDTMRFFKTRILDWDPVTGYFITSEQPPHGGRRYSIRKADFGTGNVKTVGEFCAFATLSAARYSLKHMAREAA